MRLMRTRRHSRHGDFLAHSVHNPELLDGVRLTSVALATVIGGITACGWRRLLQLPQPEG